MEGKPALLGSLFARNVPLKNFVIMDPIREAHNYFQTIKNMIRRFIILRA